MRSYLRHLLAAAIVVFPTAHHAQDSSGLPAEEDPLVQSQDPLPLYGPPDDDPRSNDRSPSIAIPAPLDRAAALAAATHPLVVAAEAEADALEYDYRGARFLRYPSLSVEALAATKGSSFADEDGLALNATLEQPIWTNGRIAGEIDRAEANRSVGENRVDEARDKVVSRVISAYYDYALAAERYEVLQESLTEHRRLLNAIERRVRQEVSPGADLTLGRSRTAQVVLDLAVADETRSNARVRLNELTGPEGANIEPVLPPPGIEDTLPPEEIALAQALDCSPSLSTLNDLVRVAETQRDIAQASLWPQVLLQLSQNEITGTRAALVLRAQLGNGLAQFRAVDAADARILRAIAEFGEEERGLREQLRRDYVLVRAASSRIEAGLLAAEAASDIVESYQRQFVAGRRSWLDVMNATREAAGARLSQTDARAAAAAATARILALSCRWQPGQAQGGVL